MVDAWRDFICLQDIVGARVCEVTDFFEPAGRGVQHASLRAANRRAVLTTIAFNPGISNADVSRRTGLAPQTASAIVAELEDDGLISRGDVLRGRRGQPATPLFLKLDAAYSIGVDVSWQHLDIVLVDLSAQPIGRYRREFAYVDATTIVGEVVGAISDLLGKLDAARRERLIGIGVASPTNIARKIGLLNAPAEQTELWKALDLTAEVEKATGVPAMWFNNGNAACWAELVMRPSPRPENFIYLFVDTLLGAGIVAEHNLWEGPTGNSANLGSVLVCRPDGGREFAHLLASTMALDRRLAEAGITRPVTNPTEWPWEEWEPVVSPWLAECGDALAQLIMTTAAVIECDLAILDGAMPRPILERLLIETREALDRLPVLTFERPMVLTGRLGQDAMPLGASFMPIFRKHFSRDLRDMASWELAPTGE
jgi:predicted NBD/HSP70 family sugar kinase